MPLATINLGSPELLKSVTADVQVDAVADYVPAYDQLVSALHAGEKIDVAVSNTTVGSWLQRVRERYGADLVQIKRLTYCQLLSERWGIEVPGWTEDLIAPAGLLDVTISAPPGREFEDFCLEVFFSPYMAQPRLPLQHLGDLLRNYDPEQWAEASERPLVGEILRRRLQAWAEKAETDGEKVTMNAKGDIMGANVELKKGSDALLSLEAKEPSRSAFPLSYLSEIVKAAAATSDIVTLEFSTDMPIRLEFKQRYDGTLVYFLAPRIEVE